MKVKPNSLSFFFAASICRPFGLRSVLTTITLSIDNHPIDNPSQKSSEPVSNTRNNHHRFSIFSHPNCSLWKVYVPRDGERVFCFLQGQMEQLETSTNQELNQDISSA